VTAAEATTGGTEGITHRRVLAIALPIVISNATIPILGAVDTAVVGQLGQAAPIGAVGLGAIILTTIYWVFGFLRMGMTGLTAQARGGGDVGETGALLMRSLLIAGVAGVACILLQGRSSGARSRSRRPPRRWRGWRGTISRSGSGGRRRRSRSTG
jgi:multidrug resistance protein, MATE family